MPHRQLIAAIVSLGLSVAANELPSDEFRTGKAFAAALDQPFAAVWENSTLRSIVRQVGEARGVAIVADRRLDPSREVSIAANGESLREFLDRLAALYGARVSVVGDTVYLGPAAAANKLRTLIALRRRELADEALNVPHSRRLSLTNLRRSAWSDLARPADIVNELTAECGLAIDEASRPIAYDLWGGSVIPSADASTALSLVLIQFDQTFAWSDEGRGVRLVKVPDEVTIERQHAPPRGATAAAALEQWRALWPDLDARIQGGEIVVRGTIERHEAIDALRQTERASQPAGRARPAESLANKRYTLRIKDLPASSLLETLSQPAHGGILFEYDAEALQRAGVDLERQVALDVKNATIRELLEQALRPLGLTFQIEGRTVRLSPAK
ncbi:MAG: secretin and TonB N-terminal domain-containing protein [Planctomycetaceae bacterium]